jgi:hypothetical protein
MIFCLSGCFAKKFVRNRWRGPRIGGSPGLPGCYSQLFRTQGALLPPFVRARPPSCWCGRGPQPGDQRQDFLEHLPRYRDLGQLEGDEAAVADHLRGDLDQLLPQAGQRTRLRGLWRREGSRRIAKVVGHGMELKANRVGGEGTA